MNQDGYLRQLTAAKPLQVVEVPVPREVEEEVVNMTRQQRRAWYRQQRKAQGRRSR